MYNIGVMEKRKQIVPAKRLPLMSANPRLAAVAQFLFGILCIAYLSIAEIIPMIQAMNTPDGFQPMHSGLRALQYAAWGWIFAAAAIAIAVNSFAVWHNIPAFSRPSKFYGRFYGRKVIAHPLCPRALRRLYLCFCTAKSVLAAWVLFALAAIAGFLYWQEDLVVYLFNFLFIKLGGIGHE